MFWIKRKQLCNKVRGLFEVNRDSACDRPETKTKASADRGCRCAESAQAAVGRPASERRERGKHSRGESKISKVTSELHMENIDLVGLPFHPSYIGTL